MKKTFISTIALLGAVGGFAASAHANSSSDLKKALIDDATPYIDLRYRYEHVDDDFYSKEAHASTLRTKLGYKTGEFHNFSANLEFENITYLGDDRFYNGVNEHTDRPEVYDPDGTELNHAFLSYTGIADTTIRLGRQEHKLDNERFIGAEGWRQNDQTFDAVAIINTSLPDTTLVYSYIDNINNKFGNDSEFGDLDTNSHVINASYSGLPVGTISAYGYILDLEDDVAFDLSSKTFGVRFSGDYAVQDGINLLYTAEYANQTDHTDNTINYDADYYVLEGGVSAQGLTVKVGYEVLGSDDGNMSFQTPLASAHKFNGWADKFTFTPNTGLEDLYVGASYEAKGVHDAIDGTKLAVVYHDFSAEEGGADYGNEWDFSISRNFMEHYSVTAKYANYNAKDYDDDTEKLWLQLGAKF